MSSPVSIKWKFRSPHGTEENFADLVHTGAFAYTSQIYYRTGQVLDSMMAEITEWMKTNAPWEDQTGRARAALQAKRLQDFTYYDEKTEVRNKHLGIMIGYFNTADPVFYSWYLETKNAGKYQIILPTLDKFGQEVFERVRSRLRLA